jgi:hypothetical protein
MSNYKSSLKKKGTSVLHEDLLLLSNQHITKGKCGFTKCEAYCGSFKDIFTETIASVGHRT